MIPGTTARPGPYLTSIAGQDHEEPDQHEDQEDRRDDRRESRSGRQSPETDPQRVHHAGLFGGGVAGGVDEAPDDRRADEGDRHRHEDDRLGDALTASLIGEHGDRQTHGRRDERDDHDPPEVVDQRAAHRREGAEAHEQQADDERGDGGVADLDRAVRPLLHRDTHHDGDSEQDHPEDERDAREHVRPVGEIEAVLVVEHRLVVVEADEVDRVLVEQREIRRTDRRDDEHHGDERQGRADEDHGSRSVVDRHAGLVVRVLRHAEPQPDQHGRNEGGDDRRGDRSVPQVGGTPGAEDPAECGTDQRSAHRGMLEEQAETGADHHADEGVDDDGDGIEAGLVGLADHRADDEPDHDAAAERDRASLARVLGLGEREAEPAERSGSGEGSDHPGQEALPRPEGDEIAVQGDAQDGTDDAEGDRVEQLPPSAHLVEEQVGADPDAGARGDGDDDRQQRAADLLLDERPVDQHEREHEAPCDAGVLLGGARRSSARAVAGARLVRSALVGTCAFECFHAVTPCDRSSPCVPPRALMPGKTTGH